MYQLEDRPSPAGFFQAGIQLRKWHIYFPFVVEIVYITFVPRNLTLMRLQSGSMVVDYYPTKSWINDNINPDKFLKILTFSGETMKKEVVTKDSMIDGINRRLARNYKVICNNTLPQYVSENVNN